MFLGICIKYNNTYRYSKPFFLNIDDDTFIAQIIRDVDYSFLINLNDTFELNVIIYPRNDSYFEANKDNIEPINFKILGKYTVNTDNIKFSTTYNNFNKGSLIKKLDNQYDVNIEFSILLLENKKDYMLSTPCITGNRNYLI